MRAQLFRGQNTSYKTQLARRYCPHFAGRSFLKTNVPGFGYFVDHQFRMGAATERECGSRFSRSVPEIRFSGTEWIAEIRLLVPTTSTPPP